MQYLLPFLLGFTLMLAFQSTVRSHSEHAQHNPWLQGLKNKDGVTCCNGQDNLPVEDWEARPDGTYHIRVGGTWYNVDRLAVVPGPNHMGAPQAWFGYDNTSRPYIRCFLPGALI